MMSAEELRDQLLAVLDDAEARGEDVKAIFHGTALAFGHALSRYLEPAAAADFMLREAHRVIEIARSDGDRRETLQ